MDLVSQTTKRALEASLKKLLLQKPLNKITINDITEDCGVNRMTFYYHFKDIYDLVDWIMVEDAAKALEGRQSFENWTDAFLDILHQVQDNKVLVMNVYRSVSREQVEQYLYKLLDSMLRDFVDRSAQGFTVQDSDKQFIIDFYKYALVGMALEWIRRDMKEDPVRMTGNAEGVKIGGKLVLSARKLTVSAQLDKLPDELVIDVTPLGVGKTIFVGDLNFDGVKFLTPATTAVCAVRVTRASRGADAAAAK